MIDIINYPDLRCIYFCRSTVHEQCDLRGQGSFVSANLQEFECGKKGEIEILIPLIWKKPTESHISNSK